MPQDLINEGAIRISGRFGEAFIIPSDGSAPMKIFEASEAQATAAIAPVDVQLSGNKVGTKDGQETRSLAFTIQEVDTYWQRLVYNSLSQNLDARRAARDAGTRISRTFTMQIWQDDPEALGAIGWQVEGVRLMDLIFGFNFADDVTNRSYTCRYEDERPIKAFERIGNTVDPTTGLPAISYWADLGTDPDSSALL